MHKHAPKCIWHTEIYGEKMYMSKLNLHRPGYVLTIQLNHFGQFGQMFEPYGG